MQHPGSDSDVIRKVLAGERQAYVEIVRKYQDKVFRLACSILGSDAAAEDAAQEVFLKTFDSLNEFRAASKFSTWLYRIASNHCLNLLDKSNRKREESLDLILERQVPLSEGPSLSEASLETKQLVQTILAALRPEERAVLVLREWEGLSYRELAEALEISVDAVKVRLFRARKAFLEKAAQLDVTF